MPLLDSSHTPECMPSPSSPVGSGISFSFYRSGFGKSPKLPIYRHGLDVSAFCCLSGLDGRDYHPASHPGGGEDTGYTGPRGSGSFMLDELPTERGSSSSGTFCMWSLALWSQTVSCLHLPHCFQSAIWPWKVEVVGEGSYRPV